MSSEAASSAPPAAPANSETQPSATTKVDEKEPQEAPKAAAEPAAEKKAATEPAAEKKAATEPAAEKKATVTPAAKEPAQQKQQSSASRPQTRERPQTRDSSRSPSRAKSAKSVERAGSPAKSTAPPPDEEVYVSKKLPQEQIDNSVQRLVRQLRKPVELPPVVAPKPFPSPTAQDAMVKRLYVDGPASTKRRLESFEQKLVSQHHMHETKKLDSSEISATVQRLFDTAIAQSQAEVQKLRSKLEPPRKEEKLTKETQQAVNERLYAKARAQTAERSSKLYEEYVVKKLPQMAKLPKADIQAAAKRMYDVKKQ
jgi:hypothetical protein